MWQLMHQAHYVFYQLLFEAVDHRAGTAGEMEPGWGGGGGDSDILMQSQAQLDS